MAHHKTLLMKVKRLKPSRFYDSAEFLLKDSWLSKKTVSGIKREYCILAAEDILLLAGGLELVCPSSPLTKKNMFLPVLVGLFLVCLQQKLHFTIRFYWEKLETDHGAINSIVIKIIVRLRHHLNKNNVLQCYYQCDFK